MSAALDQLLRHPAIWRTRAISNAAPEGIPTGYVALDEALPEGGWPVGALTEVLSDHEGFGELRLVMPALAHLSSTGRWIVWVAPPYVPYAPALSNHGVELSRLLWVHGSKASENLWAAEQALRSRACAAVLLWPSEVNARSLRRLQLAAEIGSAWGLLFRSAATAKDASPAALRLRLEPSSHGLGVEVLKCRGRNGARIEIRD